MVKIAIFLLFLCISILLYWFVIPRKSPSAMTYCLPAGRQAIFAVGDVLYFLIPQENGEHFFIALELMHFLVEIDESLRIASFWGREYCKCYIEGIF